MKAETSLLLLDLLPYTSTIAFVYLYHLTFARRMGDIGRSMGKPLSKLYAFVCPMIISVPVNLLLTETLFLDFANAAYSKGSSYDDVLEGILTILLIGFILSLYASRALLCGIVSYRLNLSFLETWKWKN